MKIITEQPLASFRFWGGARRVAARLTDEEFDQIEAVLEEIKDLDETGLNDIFWFDTNWIIGDILELSEDEFWEREPDMKRMNYYNNSPF